MALTANTLPAIPPLPPLPLDTSFQYASAQAITATGYVNNVNQQIDLANGASTSMGAGRGMFLCVLDVTAESGTTPSFNFVQMGSNDVNWGNGNVENLMSFDTAPASAQRVVTTIMGASPAIPDTGRNGSLIIKPFWNFGQGLIVYRYLRLYCVAAGTSPSITLSAWVAPIEMRL